MRPTPIKIIAEVKPRAVPRALHSLILMAFPMAWAVPLETPLALPLVVPLAGPLTVPLASSPAATLAAPKPLEPQSPQPVPMDHWRGLQENVEISPHGSRVHKLERTTPRGTRLTYGRVQLELQLAAQQPIC